MTKPKIKHISAIVRAQNLLETGINITDNPALAKSIQKDVLLLCEVRDILYTMIENPSLPFLEPEPKLAQPILDQIDAEPDGAF